jgi:hypothetical protein
VSHTETRTKEAVPVVEYHVDVIETSKAGGNIDVDALLRQLRGAGSDGWELVSAGFDIDLERFGRSHLLLFKRCSGAG